MILLQTDASVSLSDLIQIIYIIGVVVSALIAWVVKIEIAHSKLGSKIELNTELDKERIEKMNEFMRDVRKELSDIHKELKPINDYITGQKAIKGNG